MDTYSILEVCLLILAFATGSQAASSESQLQRAQQAIIKNVTDLQAEVGHLGHKLDYFDHLFVEANDSVANLHRMIDSAADNLIDTGELAAKDHQIQELIMDSRFQTDEFISDCRAQFDQLVTRLTDNISTELDTLMYRAQFSLVLLNMTLTNVNEAIEESKGQECPVGCNNPYSNNQRWETDRYLATSCEETKVFDPSLASGPYSVDPDGLFQGDDPISVHCDMATGSTVVDHDRNGLTDVVDCYSPGCHQVDVTYDASVRQLTALTRMSRQCHQSFTLQFRCSDRMMILPESSWWQDRHGEVHYLTDCTVTSDPETPDRCTLSQCPEHRLSHLLPVTGLYLGHFTNGTLVDLGSEITVRPNSVRKSVSVVHVAQSRFTLGPVVCSGRFEDRPMDMATVAPTTAPRCPTTIGSDTDCHSVQGGCYCLVRFKQTWPEAASHCQSHGMQLVSIETRAEQDTLINLLSQTLDVGWWWTSGSYSTARGVWTWLRDPLAAINYTNWGSSYDGTGSSDRSADKYIQLIRDWSYQWGPYAGSDRDSSICEL